ncbi:Sec63 Brl domain-containing protein, partial [Cokeromyces recurvatus]|uniref:Sec63 Brl domain-containing protein n=1 Tax=Cokeromyces recurvatus TaxID=90255 RepID=UPI00221E4E42
FLHEPFPVESSLHKFLDDHINAEIVGGTIKTKQDAMDYLTWTYFYRRLQQNPTYYGLDDMTQKGIDVFLSDMINDVAQRLEEAGCIEIIDDFELIPLISAHIASYYYLHPKTVHHFRRSIHRDSAIDDVLDVLGNVPEYEELPARCQEDVLNAEIEKFIPYEVKGTPNFISPHVKAYVLVQAHVSRLELPSSDYITDQITVLDSAIRFCQAMIDVAADNGYLKTSLTIMQLLQCVKQARWPNESPILTLPYIEKQMLSQIRHKGKPVKSLTELIKLSHTQIFSNIKDLDEEKREEIRQVLNRMPLIHLKAEIESKKPYLIPESTYKISIQLNRITKKHYQHNGRVHAPFFPKPQYESWWIVLGDTANDELLALKRVSMRNGPNETLVNRTHTSVTFETPAHFGKHQYTLYLISDGYLGLDQQIEIPFETRMD